MDLIIIKGGRRLKGEVTISGAKNAALPLVASAILTGGRNTFKNVPALKDVGTMANVLRAVFNDRMLLDDFSGKRVTVMGLGRFGGGVGVTQWLAGQRADVLVTDLAPAERLQEPLARIQPLVDAGAIHLRLGGHEEEEYK